MVAANPNKSPTTHFCTVRKHKTVRGKLTYGAVVKRPKRRVEYSIRDPVTNPRGLLGREPLISSVLYFYCKPGSHIPLWTQDCACAGHCICNNQQHEYYALWQGVPYPSPYTNKRRRTYVNRSRILANSIRELAYPSLCVSFSRTDPNCQLTANPCELARETRIHP